MTEAELLAFLAANDEGKPDPEAMTIYEMSELSGISECTLKRKMTRLCRQGKMEMFRDWRVTNGGYSQRYPVYRVVRHREVT